MRNPGERLPSGNEENNEQLTDARAAKIGRSIFGLRQRMAERRHEKSVQKTLAEIAALTDAGEDGQGRSNRRNLESFQKGYCDNLSDERVVGAILDSFTSFRPDYLASLVNSGVPAETILGNEKLRKLCASSLEDMLTSASAGEGPYNSISSPLKWFSSASGRFLEGDKFRQAFFESVLKDEDIRKQIIENVGTETIANFGDRVLDDLVDDTYRYGYEGYEDDTATIDSRFEIIKALGYDYFREGEKDERVSGLVGKDNARRCEILNKLGYIDGDIVSGMYAARLDIATNYLKHGELPESSGYHRTKRDEVKAALYIPWGLEPNEDDEVAAYWRKQNEKCGFDALAFVTQTIREKADTGLYPDEKMMTWLDGGKINDAFFDSARRGSPLRDVENAFCRFSTYGRLDAYENKADSIEDLLIFYSNNSERIDNQNTRGLITNWAKINGETEKETKEARIAYLKYIAQGSDRFIPKYNPDTGEKEDILFFDEDGTPTDAFYDFQRIIHYFPKSFLPFIDEKWQDHYTPGELAGIEFLDYFKPVADLLPKSLFEKTKFIDENGEEQVRPWIDSLPKYFDENGPTRALFEKCLAEGCSGFFAHMNHEDLEKAGLDSFTIQVIESTLKNEAPTEPFESSNIVAALATFIRLDADDWFGASETEQKVREAFASGETKDLAMNALRAEYERYLRSEDGTEFPVGLAELAHFMHKNDGAGPLVQIEAFLDFAGVVGVDDECKNLTSAIEARMAKNHWDNQEKTNFYAVSAEILRASPDLYKEFAELFVNIKDKGDFETFTKDIYPLYRAKLALLRNYDYSGDGIGHGVTEVNYDAVDKEGLKNQLHNALLPFNLQELSPDKRREGIDKVREIILGEITELFREKLGIRPEAIPDTFAKADIAAIEDMSLYLSNINQPSKTKKDLIGLFLALRLDRSGGWETLRSGGFIDVGKYMGIEAGYTVDQCIRTSRENDPVNAENTGISEPERLGEFRSALQEEVSIVRIGSIQTIDQRLQNLISNIEDLTDPDLYPEDTDKKKIVILERYSPKSVGSVAAKMWQRESGKKVEFSEDEEEIVKDLEKLLTDQGLEITPENIKTNLQDGFNTIKIPFTIRQVVEDNDATEAIGELQKSLMPPENIATIFGKIGEEFKPQSGVLAVGADLEFLENLIIKHEDKLDESEKAAVREYISGIRAKMSELETIYEKIAKNFEKYQKSMHGNEEPQLLKEVEEVSKIITGSNTQTAITTTCTNNMSTIINNMRACLSAKTKGCNNDTDLTFGEGYKFYLYSSSGSMAENGSTTDEIVYFIPEEYEGEKSLCFVMDQVYGHKNTEIFTGHVDTIIKKAEALKKQFPEVPIRIFIPNSTFSGASIATNAEDFSGKIALPAGATIRDTEAVSFNVPQSGFADHYIEFGDAMGPRESGERKASGIEIIL